MNETLISEEARQVLKETAMVVLKPDAIRLFLDGPLIRDLEASGLDVYYRQLIQFNKTDVLALYPNLLPTPELYLVNEEYMTSGLSMILFVRTEQKTDDITAYIEKIKGKADTGGLRNKYIKFVPMGELKQIYSHKDALRYAAQNRIHSPNDIAEAHQQITDLWKRFETVRMAQTLPEFVQTMSQEAGVYAN